MAGERDTGLQALQSGDVNTAIKLLNAAIAVDPSDYQAHIYLGAAYSKANRTPDAIDVLTKSIELQPSNPQARYNLGIAMERGGHMEQAAALYEQALTLQPEYPKAREALGRARVALAPPSPVQPVVHQAPPKYGAPSGAAPQSPLYDVPGTTSNVAQENRGYGAQSPYAQAAPQYGAQLPTVAPGSYGVVPGAVRTGLDGTQIPAATPPQYGAAPTAPQQQYGVPPAPYGAPPSPYGAPPSPYGAPPSPYVGPRPLPSQTTSHTSDNSFEGSVAMALLFGAIGGVIGTALWCGIILMTHVSTGLIGLGVGAIVGFLIRKGNGGGSTTGGILASVITVLSSVAGNIIAAAMLPHNSVGASIGFSIAGIFIAYRIASS